MFTLFRGLYDRFTHRDQFYILIIGLDNAGKTTLLERIKSLYTHRTFSSQHIIPTVGMNASHIDFPEARITFQDLGGARELHKIWESYYADAHGIIFVMDAGDRARLEECQETLERVLSRDEVEGAPLLMLANKMDREDVMPMEEIKEVFNKMAVKMDAQDSRVLPVSALSGTGVQDAVEWIVSRVVFNRDTRPPIIAT